MIKVTRLNGKEYYLNSDMIETVEATPDTIIATVNGKKFVVREPVGEVVARVVRFRAEIGAPRVIAGGQDAAERGAAAGVAGESGGSGVAGRLASAGAGSGESASGEPGGSAG